MNPESLSSTCLAALQTFFSQEKRVLEWGITPAKSPPNADLLRNWVDRNHHAGMEFMAARLHERLDPKVLHPWAESVLIFSFPYAQPLAAETHTDQPLPYKVAAYARGEDYHKTARAIWRAAEDFLKAHADLADIRFYGFSDTAPVFERDLASEAGLGWRGKNCCTLHRKHGSAFHLGGFFLNIPLPASIPLEEFCGGCTRCIDQCPTDAFVSPGQLDANKCISFWTIEARGAVPEKVSNNFQNWIFGCDICQEVCPWNHKHLGGEKGGRFIQNPLAGNQAPIEGETTVSEVDSPNTGVAWVNLLRKGGGFRSRYKRSPLMRAGRRSVLRNLAIAARNLKDTSVIEPLQAALAEETDPDLRTEIERTLKVLLSILG